MFDESSMADRALPEDSQGETPAMSAGAARFHSCRWQKSGPDVTPHCTHRDVLPMAGTTAFNAEAWCPDCPHYKLRRTPRKPPFR
jgi:hypothetical protein